MTFANPVWRAILSKKGGLGAVWRHHFRSTSEANDSGRTLTGTSRLSLVSRARYTSPMPPAPSGATLS
jgi:hypothetical protein